MDNLMTSGEIRDSIGRSGTRDFIEDTHRYEMGSASRIEALRGLQFVQVPRDKQDTVKIGMCQPDFDVAVLRFAKGPIDPKGDGKLGTIGEAYELPVWMLSDAMSAFVKFVRTHSFGNGVSNKANDTPSFLNCLSLYESLASRLGSSFMHNELAAASYVNFAQDNRVLHARYLPKKGFGSVCYDYVSTMDAPGGALFARLDVIAEDTKEQSFIYFNVNDLIDAFVYVTRVIFSVALADALSLEYVAPEDYTGVVRSACALLHDGTIRQGFDVFCSRMFNVEPSARDVNLFEVSFTGSSVDRIYASVLMMNSSLTFGDACLRDIMSKFSSSAAEERLFALFSSLTLVAVPTQGSSVFGGFYVVS